MTIQVHLFSNWNVFCLGRNVTQNIDKIQLNKILSPLNYRFFKLWKIGWTTWTTDVIISECMPTYRATNTINFIYLFFILGRKNSQ